MLSMMSQKPNLTQFSIFRRACAQAQNLGYEKTNAKNCEISFPSYHFILL